MGDITHGMAYANGAVPLEPWIVETGRIALRHGVYVYEANPWQLTLGASNGSIDGKALMRYWLPVAREALDDPVDREFVADYAAQEIRRAVDQGYRMVPA